MNVSFIKVASIASFNTLVDTSALQPGGIYFVVVKANPLVLSIVKAETANTYVVVLGNSVATKPTLGTNGRSLTYYDAGGGAQSIDLSGLTVGDKVSADQDIPSGPGDGSAYLGTVKNADTVAVAIAKLQNRMDDEFGGFATDSELSALRNELTTMVQSMMKLKGDVISEASLKGMIGCRIGSAYRSTISGTFNLYDGYGAIQAFKVEPGDLIVVINDNIPDITTEDYTGATVGWTVLQNNLDLTSVLGEVASGASDGKMLTALNYANGVLSASYTSILDVVIKGWTALTSGGAIAENDTVATALGKLQFRIAALEVTVADHTNRLTWVEIA